MKRTLLLLLLLLGLPACERENGSHQDDLDTSASADSAAPSSSQGASSSIDTMAILRSLTAEQGVEVVRNYYEALNNQEYEKAFGYMYFDGQTPAQGAEGFKQEYSEAKSFTVDIGKPEDIKEAEGIRSVTVPLKKLTMAMKSGESYNLKGTYTLQGVLTNGTPEWRIRMVDIVAAE